MRRKLTAVLATGALWTVLGAPPAQAQDPSDGAPPDLRGLLEAGWILQDRNGDGHPDFVHVRIVIPAEPAEADVAAAANLGARLAFESHGTDLDLLRHDGPAWAEPGVGAAEGAPVLVVGRSASVLGGAGVDLRTSLADLAPGEGAIQRLPASGVLPRGGTWVAGSDATGLLAAAEYLAGRYPGVWAPDGAAYGEVAEALVELLEGEEIPADGLTLDRVVVSSTRQGVARLITTLRLDDADEVARARMLLRREAPEGDADDEGDDDEPPADPRTVLVPGLHRLDVRLVGPEGTDEVHRIQPERPWSLADPQAWQVRDVSDFTLSDLYTLDGIFRDTRQDLVPDRSDAYLSLHGTAAAGGAVNLAQRIGLETAGLRFPLVRVAGEDDRPGELGFPILYGVEHYAARRLEDEGRLGVPTGAPGQGFVELVAEALDDKHVLVVGGTDGDGLAAAANVASRGIPYLHVPEEGRRKGSYLLADVETEVRRFLQARSAAGQVALSLEKVEQWMARLEAGERPVVPASDQEWPPGPLPAPVPTLEALHVELAVDSLPSGLGPHLEARLRSRFPGADVEVELHPVAFGVAEPVLARDLELDWEVDDVRAVLRDEAYPAMTRAGAGGTIEIRVSEPPEVRRALEAEIRDSLQARGVDDDAVDVLVLNAYKQGFSWIEDRILPRLRELAADGWTPGAGGGSRIEIRYRHLQESDEVRWQVMGSDTRWLQELFPVDAVLARELGIPDSMVVFRGTREAGEPVYQLTVRDGSGSILLEDTFTPTYVVEPYFHLYPDYERVRITTGWIRVEADAETVVDRRVRTDLERFWDEWQAEVLPALRDYVMDVQEGRIAPDNAPFFDELVIEARLSEPNHRIGIDEEVISSLESLHNDLYFHTLAFLGHLGQHYGVGSLDYPGRILPHIDPDGAGRPGRVRISLTGRNRASPELILRVRSGGEEPARWRYPLGTLPTETPKLRGIGVDAGRDGVGRLLFDVMARDSVDRLDEHRGRSSEAAIDRSFLSVEMLEGMVDRVRELHAAGIMEEALSFERVGELVFRFLVEDEDDFQRAVILPRSAGPASTRNPVVAAPGWEHDGSRLVQWDTPIPPAESDSIMARLGTFPEATVYFVGRSYLGRNIFAADLHPPVQTELVSQAKLNATRPTILLSGRQHANEVSSTSHILRLGELLVTDPDYREILQGANVVLHPITNPDGAQLAWEMQQVNPDFTLHAGYLGALGVDATSGSGSGDPIYPESTVRPRLMATWLPDIYLNLHGYPSHEWVQHFSGYAAWVRGRTVTSRTWWAPRGWFIPGFTWVDDPEHPEITTAQFAMLDTIAAAITGVPEVAAMSQRQYARYAKYGRQEVDGFREHFHEGVLVYLSLTGRTVSGSGPGNPRINTFSATTEAPDETARGEWLDLVATAGLAHTSALARYLAGGVNRVEREAEAFDGWITRQVWRVRPVLPQDEEGEDEPEEGEPGG